MTLEIGCLPRFEASLCGCCCFVSGKNTQFVFGGLSGGFFSQAKSRLAAVFWDDFDVLVSRKTQSWTL